MTTNEPLNILLYLDPWRDNPISVPQVLEQIGGDVIVHALHDHGVKPSLIRNDGIPWDEWVKAVESMLQACEADLERAQDRDPHYYVCGRAPLPIFAYLGARLSKWATRATLINRREATWDRIEFPAGAASDEPFFQPTQRQQYGVDSAGKVVVFVSTDYTLDLPTISTYMREAKAPIASVVEMRTAGRRWLTAANAAAAAAEIDAEFGELRRHYPRHTGLVVFVAGPAQLAFLVGRAVNPRVHVSAEFPHFAGPDYVPAVRYPQREEIPRFLILTANPHDQKNIRDSLEIRDIRQEFGRSRAGRVVEPLIETSVTPEDFLNALSEHQPHILHLIAHGSEEGDIGLVKEDGTMSRAPLEGIKRALVATAKSARLIVINACFSDRLAEQLAEHFDYVIGVKDPAYTTTAIAFAKSFYRALGDGNNLSDALKQGLALPALKNLWGTDRYRAFSRAGFDPTSWTPYPERILVARE